MTTSPGTVVITGGSSGIGRALAWRFARAGHALIITGRNGNALENEAAEIRERFGVSVVPWVAELGTEAGIEALAERLIGLVEPIEVLVNNAGSGLHGNFLENSGEADRTVMTLHQMAPCRLTKAVVPGMLRHGRGTILNVASVYSFAPAPWQALYGAAKSWVLSFSLALREELRGTGVRVVTLCPGTTASRFRTRLGLSDKASWFTLSAGEVAEAAFHGVRRNQAVVVPGFYYKLYVGIARLLPTAWLGRFVYHTAYRLRNMPVPRHGGRSSS